MSGLFDLDAVVAGVCDLCGVLLRGSAPYGEVTPCAVQLGGGGNTLSRLLHQRSEGGEAAWR